MAITARIAGEQGGDLPYLWSLEYDDVTRRVTAEASGNGNVRVEVTITTGGGTRVVDFVQPGRTPDPDTDFTVTMGSGPTLIGPTIAPAQVARIVGKIGTVTGGLPFSETWSRG